MNNRNNIESGIYIQIFANNVVMRSFDQLPLFGFGYSQIGLTNFSSLPRFHLNENQIASVGHNQINLCFVETVIALF